MNTEAKTRLADYKADIAAVLDGSRPLAIVEHIKSPEAHKLAYQAGDGTGATIWHHDLLSSNGETGPAIALARGLQDLARYQHLRNTAKDYTRVGYQRALGTLLGYKPADIAEFMRSDIAKRCPCELCGSRAHANQNELDAYKARSESP